MKRVLIIDDNASLAGIYATILRESGYQVQVARSAQQCLESLSSQGPFDLILMDWLMPDGGGAYLLSVIHSHFPDLHESTHIVGFSSLRDPPRDYPSYLSGFEEKPNGIQDFLRLVENYCGTAGAGESAQRPI